MTNTGIFLTILVCAFLIAEVSAIVAHWFEASKGAFILKKENSKRQWIIHSTFDQMAIGIIVNYESVFFISIHILNLHFCFIYTPKKFRSQAPALSTLSKPLIGIVEWMNNGLEKAAEFGGGSEFYFNPLAQGYDMKDVDTALQHFRDLGSKAYWVDHRQEIVLNIQINGKN